MGTDWYRVLEVFFSGILGVFVVMILLQVLTQLSTRIIDLIENWNKGDAPASEPQAAVAKEKA